MTCKPATPDLPDTFRRIAAVDRRRDTLGQHRRHPDMTAMEAAPYAGSQGTFAAHALIIKGAPHIGATGIADLLVPGGDHTRDRIKRAQWQAAREAARAVIDARSPIRTDREGIITHTAETRAP